MKKIIIYSLTTILLLFSVIVIVIFVIISEGDCGSDDYCLEEEPYYSKGP